MLLAGVAAFQPSNLFFFHFPRLLSQCCSSPFARPFSTLLQDPFSALLQDCLALLQGQQPFWPSFTGGGTASAFFSNPSTKSLTCPGSFPSKASHTCSNSLATFLTHCASSFSRSSPHRSCCTANSRSTGLPVAGAACQHICPTCHPKGPVICSLSPLTGPLKALSQGWQDSAKLKGCSSYKCKIITSKNFAVAKHLELGACILVVFLLKLY